MGTERRLGGSAIILILESDFSVRCFVIMFVCLRLDAIQPQPILFALTKNCLKIQVMISFSSLFPFPGGARGLFLWLHVPCQPGCWGRLHDFPLFKPAVRHGDQARHSDFGGVRRLELAGTAAGLLGLHPGAHLDSLFFFFIDLFY